MLIHTPSKANVLIIWDMNNVAWRNVNTSFKNKHGYPSGHIYITTRNIISYVSKRTDNVCNIWCFDSEIPDRMLLANKCGFIYKDRKHSTIKAPKGMAVDPVADIRKLVQLIPGVVAYVEGVECDSVMASVAYQYKDKECYIISNDRDMWSLAHKCHVVFGKKVVTTEDVIDYYGVKPKHVALYKAVFGDSSDTIPPILPRLTKSKIIPIMKVSNGKPKDFLQKLAKGQPTIYELFTPKIKKYLKQRYKLTRLDRKLQVNYATYGGNQEGLDQLLESFDIRSINTNLLFTNSVWE